MRFTIPRKELLRVAARCQGVADKKALMPALSKLLLTAEEPSTVKVAATDTYISVVSFADADVHEEGSVAVPAKDLFERIKAMPDGQITVEAGTTGKCSVKSDTTLRRYGLLCMESSAYPLLPEPDEYTLRLELEIDVLHRLICQSEFSISTDEARAPLNSALFEWDGTTVRMVSADRHRLTKVEAIVAGRDATAKMLIPGRAIAELRKLAEEAMGPKSEAASNAVVTIKQSSANAFFAFPNTRFSTRLTEATFPSYQNAILDGPNSVVHVENRLYLIDALRAVSLASSDKTGGVKLTFDSDLIRITSESPMNGDGHDEIAVEYDGPERIIGVNAGYLIDVLGVLEGDEVEMQLFGDLDPIVIKPVREAEGQSFLNILMPMRI
jgi:DNA polymerase-3 subunit beta